MPRRTFYLDNFRTFLTALVILHHSSAPYGGIGFWLYSPSRHRPAHKTPPPLSNVAPSQVPLSLPVLAFNVIDQTFFMAAFFLLSGYFSSISAARRSRYQFVNEKWKRLGLPTVVYSVVSKSVIAGVIARVRDRLDWSTVGSEAWDGVRSVRGVRGPVWYCALLLIFDVVYAVVRPGDFGSALPGPGRKVYTTGTEGPKDGEKRTTATQQKAKSVRTLHVLAALAMSSMSSFLIRVYCPIRTPFTPLNLRVGYIPQYALFYSTGVFTHRHLKTQLPELVTRRTQAMLCSLITAITAFGLWVLNAELAKDDKRLADVLKMGEGGFETLAFLYAAWNECMGVLICSFLLHTFASRSWLGVQWAPFGFDLARFSYAAFLVHALVVVTVQCLLDGWEAGAVLKSAVVGLMGCVASWADGWVLVSLLEGIGIRGVV